ncbi:alpha/beta fold hydrolase [Nonomuraea terrae]|uniref:alpha/beta fold hydrolase n=1 Tax=Nonomuraea terrae TaxID=2530383 RepID=UPI0037925506
MPDVHVTVWDRTGGGGQAVLLVHGAMCWGDDPVHGFAAQRPLSDRYRLLAMDRRGHGRSPDPDGGHLADYLADADDIVGLLQALAPGGAHLVGHSYGGVSVMLAAARVPALVRSLALIEPGCYQAAADDPVVAAALTANRDMTGRIPADLPAEVYLRAACETVGLPPLEATPERLRAAGSSVRERFCWEAPIPVAELAAAPWPKLMISGTWETAPELYRRRGGEPLMACARVTAQRIGAELRRIPAAAHNPHVEQPEAVNAALLELWEGVARGRARSG